MAEHLPHLIFTAMLRAVTVAWGGDGGGVGVGGVSGSGSGGGSNDPAATLEARVEYAARLGRAFSVAPAQFEQVSREQWTRFVCVSMCVSQAD